MTNPTLATDRYNLIITGVGESFDRAQPAFCLWAIKILTPGRKYKYQKGNLWLDI